MRNKLYCIVVILFTLLLLFNSGCLAKVLDYNELNAKDQLLLSMITDEKLHYLIDKYYLISFEATIYNERNQALNLVIVYQNELLRRMVGKLKEN